MTRPDPNTPATENTGDPELDVLQAELEVTFQKVFTAWRNLERHPDAEELLGQLGDRMYQHPTWTAWEAQGLIPPPVMDHVATALVSPQSPTDKWLLTSRLYQFMFMQELTPLPSDPAFADWPGSVTQTGDWLRDLLEDGTRIQDAIEDALHRLESYVNRPVVEDPEPDPDPEPPAPRKRSRTPEHSYPSPFRSGDMGFTLTNEFMQLSWGARTPEEKWGKDEITGERYLKPRENHKQNRLGAIREPETWMTTPPDEFYQLAESPTDAVKGLSPTNFRYVELVMMQFVANPDASRIKVKITDLLAWGGAKPKRDSKGRSKGWSREDKQAVIETLFREARIYYRGRIEPRGKKSAIVTYSSLFSIIGWDQQLKLDGMTDGGYPDVVAVTVVPGDWWDQMRDIQPLQVAPVSRALLQLDRGRETAAFQLGEVLNKRMRIRASRKDWSTPYGVRDLLQTAHLLHTTTDPGKRRTSFEQGLHKLQEIGEIGSWEYVAPYHPKSGPPMSGRGWHNVWLDARVVILPPADLIERYASIAENRKAKLAAGSKKPRKPRAKPNTDGA